MGFVCLFVFLCFDVCVRERVGKRRGRVPGMGEERGIVSSLPPSSHLDHDLKAEAVAATWCS